MRVDIPGFGPSLLVSAPQYLYQLRDFPRQSEPTQTPIALPATLPFAVLCHPPCRRLCREAKTISCTSVWFVPHLGPRQRSAACASLDCLGRMSGALRVLIVEDSPGDAEQLLRQLRRVGYEPCHQRVQTAEALKAALRERVWDVVVADHHPPSFSAPAALRIVRESGLDLPFLILSGVVSHEAAVAAMRAGAHDYIRKDNPARLIPAIAREVGEAEIRCKGRRLEEALRQAQKMDMIGHFAGVLAHEFSNIAPCCCRNYRRTLSCAHRSTRFIVLRSARRC